MVQKILIVNQPLGNRGDEAAHRALIRSINASLPNVKVTILWVGYKKEAIDEFRVEHPNNEYVNLLLPHNWLATDVIRLATCKGFVRTAVLVHPVLKKVRPYYDETDLVLCAPGGICMGGFRNWSHMFFLQLAKLCNKPLVYYSRSFGPFSTTSREEQRFYRKAIEMLRYFSFLSIRDNITMRLADEMKINYIPAIDTAFLESPSQKVAESVYPSNIPYVVFVPNKLTWHYAYKKFKQESIDVFFEGVIETLKQRYPNHRILMLPQTSTIYTRGDYYYFLELKSRSTYASDIDVLPDIYSSDVQQSLIASSDLVVGARYHSIVFAINNAKPFVALNYEHKIGGLLEMLNLESKGVDIREIFYSNSTIQNAIDQVKTILTKDVDYDVNEKRSKAHKIAKNCFEQFVKTIV